MNAMNVLPPKSIPSCSFHVLFPPQFSLTIFVPLSCLSSSSLFPSSFPLPPYSCSSSTSHFTVPLSLLPPLVPENLFIAAVLTEAGASARVLTLPLPRLRDFIQGSATVNLFSFLSTPLERSEHLHIIFFAALM